MAQRAKDMIAALPATMYRAELAGQHMTYQFEVADAGIWRLRNDDGHLRMQDGPGEADTVFTCTEQDFIDVFFGKRNLFTAVLQGRIEVRGNLAHAIQFQRLLSPAPLVTHSAAQVTP